MDWLNIMKWNEWRSKKEKYNKRIYSIKNRGNRTIKYEEAIEWFKYQDMNKIMMNNNKRNKNRKSTKEIKYGIKHSIWKGRVKKQLIWW